MALKLRRVAPLTLAAVALAATPAAAAPDRVVAEPLGVDKTSLTWSGKADPGANVSFLPGNGSCASTGPDTMCDQTLVRLADDFKSAASTTLKFKIGKYVVPAADYDLRVYESNASGTPKTHLGSPTSETYGPAGAAAAATAPGDEESFTVTGSALKKGKFYLVEVVYFAAAGGYTGTIELKNALREEPAPVPGPATR